MKYNTKHWSKELDKYKNGTQSDTERYQLEKSALDDVFLFEALEGYSNNAFANEDKSSIPGAAKSKATIFSMRNLAVAASLVLLVGIVGYMQNQFNDNSIDQSLADIELNEPSLENEESRKTIVMNIPDTEVEEGDIEKPSNSNTDKQSNRKIVTLQKTKSKLPESMTIDPKPESIEQGAKANISVQSPNTQMSIGESGQDIASSIDKESVENESPVVEKKILSKRSSKSKLSLTPSKSDLSTDDTPGHTYSLDGISISSAKVNVTPPMGWKGFESYIKKNKKQVATLKSVTVEVSFSVDSDGKLLDVKTNNTSCQACEKEAIRLIKSSGVWKNLKGTLQSVSHKITF